MVANVEPLWAQDNEIMRDLTTPRLGEERRRWRYPIGSLVRDGAAVSFGSDWPVSSHEPLDGTWLAGRCVRQPPGKERRETESTCQDRKYLLYCRAPTTAGAPMNASRPRPTPDEARACLDASGRAPLRNRRDRRIHAIYTAAIGVVIAMVLATRNVLSVGADVVLSVVVFGLMVAVLLCMERTSTTVPRRVRLLSRVGVGVSFVLGLTATLPWLNLRAQTEPNTWGMVLGAAAVTALPSLAAAVAIARGRR